MTTWPFGSFLNASFSDEEQTGFSELTPDAGVPFRREVFSDIQNLVSGTLNLTTSDYLAFKQFYRNDTSQGTIPFDYYDCRFDVTRTARFIGKPSYARLSNLWSVSVSLSLESAAIEAAFDLIAEDGTTIIAEDGTTIVGVIKYEV